MSKAPAALAFPTWRHHWASLAGVSALLSKADDALRRRAAGNHGIPLTNGCRDDERLAAATAAMRQWAEGSPPKDTETRPIIIRRIHAITQPKVRSVVWPRWLLLERAFLDGSTTGDLLFAALTLRTMCEEVQRLHALDLNAEQLAHLASSNLSADRERLELYLSAAWTSLGPLSQEMILAGEGWPSLRLMAAAMPRLERARGSLNSYVHPNYGSHVAALFPECTLAARLLLEAVIVVYEEFFRLSWAERPAEGPCASPAIGSFETWARTVDRFRSSILPDMQRATENPAAAELMKAPGVIEWLTAARPDLAAMISEPTLAPLLEGLPRQEPAQNEGSEVSPFALWDGARAIDLLGFAAARRAEESLSKEFPSGAPDPSEQIRWLRFNRLSLDLALLLDQVKVGAFKTQLVRQITQGNSLAALLCTRSLIEHRALAVWLPKAIGTSLHALATGLQAAKPLPGEALRLEQHLANFLTAEAKRSQEDRRSWVVNEHGGVRTAWLNLTNIVETAFPGEDRFRRIYALTSAAMHGRIQRGIELTRVNGVPASHACGLGLLVLERLCEDDADISGLAEATRLSVQLAHAERFGGTPAAVSDAMAQQVFGLLDGPLTLGIDYTGEGTVDDPFCLSPHLQFHLASPALLKQMGVEVLGCVRELTKDNNGRFCDRWQAPERTYWFLVDLTAIPFLGLPDIEHGD